MTNVPTILRRRVSALLRRVARGTAALLAVASPGAGSRGSPC